MRDDQVRGAGGPGFTPRLGAAAGDHSGPLRTFWGPLSARLRRLCGWGLVVACFLSAHFRYYVRRALLGRVWGVW